jgi:hypothetical protein
VNNYLNSIEKGMDMSGSNTSYMSQHSQKTKLNMSDNKGGKQRLQQRKYA